MSLFCEECGLPVVPFGGEDVCLQSCPQCGSHDCQCEPGDDDLDDEDLDQ